MGDNKNVKQRSGLRRKLLVDTIVPVLILITIVLVAVYHSARNTVNSEVYVELKNLEYMVEQQFDTKYPGDYHKRITQNIVILKGTQIMNDEYEIIDQIKQNCNVDITLFYGDMRVITTLMQDNVRINGTEAPYKVINEVLEQDQEGFYNDVKVNGKSYYAYYNPIHNSDGTCVGMIFIGKPRAMVIEKLVNSVLPICMVTLFGVFLIGIVSIYFTNSIVSDVTCIRKHLADIASGNLSGQLGSTTLTRDDEIGDIATSVVNMQQSLRTIVERDSLTEIYNRRRGTVILDEIMKKYRQLNIPFHLAIGDIDFFKKVNDTYGHEAGDRVLQNVASILKMNMVNCGYAARWGGEEFLLVFQNMSYEKAILSLNQILEQIRSSVVMVNQETKITVTMTFGLVKGCEQDSDSLFRTADELLYKGKKNGRNQIITVEGVCECRENTINFLTLSLH